MCRRLGSAEANDVQVEIGPVAAAAARDWTAHMGANLRALRPLRHRLPFRLPDEVIDAIAGHLDRWHRHALACGEVFHVVDEIDEAEVRTLVRYWANLDSLSDEQVASLGVDWSSAAARPFFDALAHGVATALAGGPGPDAFAELLVEHVGHPVRSVHPPCNA
jgi:hypothetical protein